MSGIRISEFKKPATIIVDQAKVDSAYGPKSSIMLETLASSYSKSGFTVEVKGLSRDSLLNGLFVVIPIQVRWQNGAHKLLPNQYPQLQSYKLAVGAGVPDDVMFQVAGSASNRFKVPPTFWSYDNICVSWHFG